MSMRTTVTALALAYFAFSVVYLVLYGFENPRSAIWIGLIGIIVIAVGITVRARTNKKS